MRGSCFQFALACVVLVAFVVGIRQHLTLLVLFTLWSLCSQIVLLNLLIALMGSIYEDERENSANHRRAERASMLLEVRNRALNSLLHTQRPSETLNAWLPAI